MENVELFFGLPLNNDFLNKFQKINPNVCLLFIHDNNNEYLQKITLNESIFIGKNIGKITDLDSLQLSQKHVISILKKLIPDHPFDSDSLVLFPLNNI